MRLLLAIVLTGPFYYWIYTWEVVRYREVEYSLQSQWMGCPEIEEREDTVKVKSAF